MTTMALNPLVIADELLARADGRHREAEVEAWKLRQAHGPATPEGQALAEAAFIIADRYHTSGKRRNINDLSQYRVPVFDRRPDSPGPE